MIMKFTSKPQDCIYLKDSNKFVTFNYFWKYETSDETIVTELSKILWISNDKKEETIVISEKVETIVEPKEIVLETKKEVVTSKKPLITKKK